MFPSFCAISLSLCMILSTGLFALSAEAAESRLIAAAKKKPEPITDPVVIMETSKGPLKLVIFAKDAPLTASNFLELVKRGFYDGLSFNRYLSGFIIQGGDPKGDGCGVYIDPQRREERFIPLELNAALRHETGSLCMARTAEPNSGSCQFYFCLEPQAKLDGVDAVFGKVLEGIQTMQALREGDKIVRAAVEEAPAKARRR